VARVRSERICCWKAAASMVLSVGLYCGLALTNSSSSACIALRLLSLVSRDFRTSAEDFDPAPPAAGFAGVLVAHELKAETTPSAPTPVRKPRRLRWGRVTMASVGTRGETV
jgi:hypothetical protein